MTKWWRGVLALLPSPTKEHFCQNPWVGVLESLPCSRILNYSCKTAESNCACHRKHSDFFPSSLFNQHCFALMTLQENELYLSTKIYFSYPDLKEEQSHCKFQFYLVRVGFFPSVSELRETPRPGHWEHEPQSFRSTRVGRKAPVQ